MMSLVFQFPSNGKVYSEGAAAVPAAKSSNGKFQFPSNGKVYSESAPAEIQKSYFKCFNSLQTGKCIQSRLRNHSHAGGPTVSIPFKRESVFRANMMRHKVIDHVGFNSLQTGKCIQSR